MKYIKTFENKENIAFSVGDTVYCVDKFFDTVGTEFKVKKIFYYDAWGNYEEPDNLKYTQLTKEYFVDVIDIKTDKTYTGLWSNKFAPETKYDALKYNL